MSDQLLADIHAFIDDEKAGDFNNLALRLFRRHFERNEHYRRYVERSGGNLNDIQHWQDIPAAPAAAFKAFDLSCVPTSDCVTMFQSSGTTGPNASRHWMDADAVSLYEHSLSVGYQAALPSLPIWAVMPTSKDSPHSSLSHMLDTLGAKRFFWDNWSSLSQALTGLRHPITLFGTGFAFVALFDSDSRVWRLPAVSVVVNTGGFKGRTREVPRNEFYASLRQRFGLGDKQCVAEYGMSEMSSQFYSVAEHGEFHAPHWLRSLVIDPATGQEVPTGSEGLLRHFDLANWNSVVAIQTQDLAVEGGDGFRLLGRAPDADVRGCSLTVEELWTR